MSLVIKQASVEEQYEKNEGLKKENVKKLMEWLEMQPHLPAVDELEAIIFLHACSYSNEAAKKCIDSYYTVKTLAPEFFANWDPCSQEIVQACKILNVTILPHKTKDNVLVLYSRLRDIRPELYSFNSSTKFFCMLMTVWLRQLGCQNGIIVCLDMHGGSFGHLAKVSLVSLKKFMFLVQEAVPFKIRGIYYVNPTSIMDKIMGLIRPLISKDLQKLIKVLPGDAVFDYIPKDHLPQEAGGTLGPLSTLAGNQLEMLQAHRAFYLQEETRKSDESKRPGKPKNEGELFGVEGTFKKLDID